MVNFLNVYLYKKNNYEDCTKTWNAYKFNILSINDKYHLIKYFDNNVVDCIHLLRDKLKII